VTGLVAPRSGRPIGSGADLAPVAGALPSAVTALPDLASRLLGGSVVAATDELFAEKENLIKPGRAVHDPSAFGNKGKIYGGWETRRRRGGGHDHAAVRLGAPGVVCSPRHSPPCASAGPGSRWGCGRTRRCAT
jgi:Allantoicase repeat